MEPILGSFPFVPPSLVGAYYLQPPDARAIFLHNDLLCNDTCSVTGGSIMYWGAQTEKIPILAPTTTKRGSVVKNENRKLTVEPMLAPTARLANDFI